MILIIFQFMFILEVASILVNLLTVLLDLKNEVHFSSSY